METAHPVSAERQISLSFPPELNAQITAWAQANDTTRNEAVRQLCALGLAIDPLDSAIQGARIQALTEARDWVWNELRVSFSDITNRLDAIRKGILR
jgi:hypothetical protein